MSLQSLRPSLSRSCVYFLSALLTFLLPLLCSFSVENRAVVLRADIEILEAQAATLRLEAEVVALELEVEALRARR